MSCDNECRIQAGFNCAVHADKEWNAAMDRAADVIAARKGIPEHHSDIADLVRGLKR